MITLEKISEYLQARPDVISAVIFGSAQDRI